MTLAHVALGPAPGIMVGGYARAGRAVQRPKASVPR